MSEEIINVAVVGTGKRGSGKEGWAIGHAHANGWLKCGRSVRLYGVDVSTENLAAFGERFQLPPSQLFASTDALYSAVRPDFVSVCTWPKLHAPMTIEAAQRGVRGILCEKPMALDMGECRAMMAACKKAGTRLAIAHQRRYDSAFQLAHKLLRSGAVGKTLSLEGRVGDDWDVLSWTTHWFDMANFLLDAKPVSVLAGMDFRGERRYQHAVERGSVVFVEYDNGHQATFISGPNGLPRYGILVRGEDGLLQINEGQDVLLWNRSGFQQLPATSESAVGNSALTAELVAGAGNERPILCGAENCMAATEIAYAAHESARTHKKVMLPMRAEFAPLEVIHLASKPAFPFKHITLVADEHFGSGGREGLADTLEYLAGQPAKLVDATKGVTAADLADAELLVMYHTQDGPDEPTRQVLQNWIAGGRPTLLVHASLGAYPNWADYHSWAGRVWVWGAGGSAHPHEPSELKVVDANRFTSGWESAWLPRDEVFIKLGQHSEVRDLLTAQISGGTYPAAWINVKHANVGVYVPGHRRDLWDLPAMREGIAAVARSLSVK